MMMAMPGATDLKPPAPLFGWCVTDVGWEQLVGRMETLDWLKEQGCEVTTVNAFDAGHEGRNPAEVSLVIMSCPCPPGEWKDYLDHLTSRYDVPKFYGAHRITMYTAVLMKVLPEIYVNATVVILVRAVDRVYLPAGRPVRLVDLKPIAGWSPKACNHPAEEPFHVLSGGTNMKALVTPGGPCMYCAEHELLGQELDLPQLCLRATNLPGKVPVLFLGEWDGLLARSCAREIMGDLNCYSLPRLPMDCDLQRTPTSHWFINGRYTLQQFQEYSRQKLGAEAPEWKVLFNGAFMFWAAGEMHPF